MGESNVTKIRTLKCGVQKRKDQFYIRKEAGSARASWQRWFLRRESVCTAEEVRRMDGVERTQRSRSEQRRRHESALHACGRGRWGDGKRCRGARSRGLEKEAGSDGGEPHPLCFVAGPWGAPLGGNDSGDGGDSKNKETTSSGPGRREECEGFDKHDEVRFGRWGFPSLLAVSVAGGAQLRRRAKNWAQN